MPTFLQSEEQFERELRLSQEERTLQMEAQARKNESELQSIREKGAISIQKAKLTHKIDSRYKTIERVGVALFTIIPKVVLIISSFWLIIFHREVPKSWNEFLSR